MQGWIVVPVILAWLGLLFLVAWLGDKYYRGSSAWRPLIYSFSIAVYCTSWTFFGTVGQASRDIFSFIPIYLGPMLVFLFGWRMLARMILIAKREHITSIADFIAARYGKAQTIGVLVTLISVAGVLPYIALQMKAISTGLTILAPDLIVIAHLSNNQLALLVGVALSIFAILFGTRNIDATEHHRGVVLAIAFESLVKLVAFLGVGVGIVWLASQQQISWQLPDHISMTPTHIGSFSIHLLLAMSAVICLPRQFHTTVVESSQPQDLHVARWVFPFYLLLMSLFVVPIALIGAAVLPPEVLPDTYVINLPLAFGYPSLSMLAFLGGASAAAGMVIVSSIALAIMVSNDLILPLLLRQQRFSHRTYPQFSGLLLNVRRITIAVLLLLAWACYLAIDQIPALADIGYLSLSAVAQFLPALIGGLYWRQGNRKGVYVGLISGFLLWLLALVGQTNLLAGTADNNILLRIITPPAWALTASLSLADWGALLSLVINAGLYIVVSLMTRASISERLQAASFIGLPTQESDTHTLYQTRVTLEELETLIARFLGQFRARRAFMRFADQRQQVFTPSAFASAELIRHSERLLAGVFGASSARLVLSSALQGRDMQLEEVATIVDEASELFDFSRTLLQGSIEHIDLGLSVIDKQLRLVAWNRRYLELFNFPIGLIHVGRPIEDIIRYNAQQGLCGRGSIEEQVRRRVAHMQQGSAHRSARRRPDGRVIELQGNPMPGGGFVMSFTDITPFIEAENALRDANESLEARVQARTRELTLLNQQLVSATQTAHQAAHSKSRFLAAVSHDLMQPLNAAKLFNASLLEMLPTGQTRELACRVEDAMTSAEELISDLLDMSRIEGGKLNIRRTRFPITEILDNLAAEFGVLAQAQHMRLTVIRSHQWVDSDRKLLRRILQNFLTNAFRYAPHGRVLLGCRRQHNQLVLQVWDNGVGIPQDKVGIIFDEFSRLDHGRTAKENGFGLGLAIAKGMANMLEHPITVESQLGKGSVFSVSVPLSHADTSVNTQPSIEPATHSNHLYGLKILCIDNEPDILDALQLLLTRWECEVKTVATETQALHELQHGWQPHIILTDYHLADGICGLDITATLSTHLPQVKVVVLSADRTTHIQQHVQQHAAYFLAKPVKPARLKMLLHSLLHTAL
ncbi:hybrid sensor histidine kinase/response regulator [Plesiomonas sp.]|uniref:hybrid sensor histidine kinase/response regulator n=1 Tax=Plesiomonas sp. TaxID=2486279 RepID=UPI003F309CF2